MQSVITLDLIISNLLADGGLADRQTHNVFI